MFVNRSQILMDFKVGEKAMKRYVVCIMGMLVVLTLPQLFVLYQRLVSHSHISQRGHGLQASVTSVREEDANLRERKGYASSFKSPVGRNESAYTFQYFHQASTPLRTIVTNQSNSASAYNKPSSDLQRRNTPDRFLFPVHAWDGGPNWNYLSFRMLIAYAITHKRNIVMVPFHNHFVEGFTKGWRSFNETFDVKALRTIVPMVTPELYIDECGHRIDFLVQFPIAKCRAAVKKRKREQYDRTRTDLRELWGIDLPNSRQGNRNLRETAREMMDADKIRCIAIHGPRRIPHFLTEKEEEVLKEVDRYFLRAAYIREMGIHVKSLLCGGKPYIAIHWRNRTGEMVEFYSIDCNPMEVCLRDFEMLSNASQVIAESVGQFMQNLGIDCVYVAVPPRRQEFVERLRNIVPHVYTANFITSRDSKELQDLEDDNYVLSLVEQEVCMNAQVFLRCGLSNWSEFVQIGRDSLGKEVVYLRDIPGIPKEIYKLI
ncbi:uncharacterized protein [Ptychodera flava]|uniref:uncharacterized protein n=1 Tax=Ptychodera flava TaxID=63121 RepID=UPI00396A46BD